MFYVHSRKERRRKASERGRRHQRMMAAERRGLVRTGDDMFRRALGRQYRDLFQRVEAGSVGAMLESVRAAPVDHAPVESTLETFYVQAARSFGEIGQELLKIEKSERYVDEVRRYLQQVAGEKITQISDTTRSDIQRLLQQAADEGIGGEEAGRLISQAIGDISRTRGTMIARTEVIPASNKAVDLAAREAGIALDKEWIATGDGRTREEHALADGQVVDIDEPYVVDGEELMFPGDSSMGASAENLIQCRCSSAPIPKE